MERLRRKYAMLGVLDRPTELTFPQGGRTVHNQLTILLNDASGVWVSITNRTCRSNDRLFL
jgi:hypothetical protein